MKRLFWLYVVIIWVSCADPSAERNLNQEKENILEAKELTEDIAPKAYQDTVYIPIYSDIYSVNGTDPTLLAATLSIRSTSFSDTTYIDQILYYNTQGTLVKNFIEHTLALPPMQSIDYVIERDDTAGGNGANFIVTWSAKRNIKPLFQAVMVSAQGNKAFAFTVDGISLKEK